MRWVFFVLFVANVALLVWRYGLGLPAQYLGEPPRATWERPVGVKKVLLKGESAETASSEESPLEQLCTWVGPFAEQAAAQTFIERIAALDVMSALKKQELTAGDGYQVYLAPLKTRTAAKILLMELQQKKIDSYIISKGELENAISLGIYSDLTLAQKRLTDINAMGYEPLLKSYKHTLPQYWVSVEESEVQKIGKSAWHRIVEDQFKLSEKQKFCLDVASR